MTDQNYLVDLYLQRHSREAADLLEDIDPVEAAGLAGEISLAGAVSMLSALSPARAAACLPSMKVDRAAECLARMDRRDALAVLRLVPGGRRDGLLQRMPAPTRLQFEMSLRQPVHRVGAWMDNHLLILSKEASVKTARQRARRAETYMGEFYVVDDDNRLIGTASPVRLLAMRGTETVESVTVAPVAVLHGSDSIHDALGNPAWEGVDCLPVVERNGRPVGSIRYATLRTAAMQQNAAPAISAGRGYIGLADNLYVGLAGLMAAAIAKPSNNSEPQSTGGGTAR